MSEGLLKRHRGNITKPGVLILSGRKHRGKIIVGELLATLFVGSGTGIQAPIVDEASTSECLSKVDPLLKSWIEPELVRPLRLAHCLFAFLLLLYMLLNGIDDLAIRRPLVLLSGFLEPLKKRGVNVDGKSLWFHTGGISLYHLYVNRLWHTCAQAPNKERAYIPRLKDGGFTPRCIKSIMGVLDLSSVRF